MVVSEWVEEAFQKWFVAADDALAASRPDDLQPAITALRFSSEGLRQRLEWCGEDGGMLDDLLARLAVWQQGLPTEPVPRSSPVPLWRALALLLPEPATERAVWPAALPEAEKESLRLVVKWVRKRRATRSRLPAQVGSVYAQLAVAVDDAGGRLSRERVFELARAERLNDEQVQKLEEHMTPRGGWSRFGTRDEAHALVLSPDGAAAAAVLRAKGTKAMGAT